MTRLLLFSIFILSSLSTYSQSKIYLIRHAKVEIEKPSWTSSKKAQKYKSDYNHSDIQLFDAKLVLDKIDHAKDIDTIFCSPQLRALQTAEKLFEEKVFFKIDTNLRELDYSVNQIPLLRLPVNAWLTMSRITWMIGSKITPNSAYKERKDDLELFAEEVIAYAESNGKSIVVAHGMLNRELIRILKGKGWKLEQNDGLGNLSVNCLTKF